MTRDQQLDLLRRQISNWNDWRRRNIDVRVDFSSVNLARGALAAANLSEATMISADLSEADLTEANLTLVDLTAAILTSATLTDAQVASSKFSNARLTGAKLTRANLNGADLSGASLAEANLRSANLKEAELDRANLTGADLTGADLRSTRLTRVNLTNTIMTNAILGDTVFSLTDLGSVVGLQECIHRGPSVLDYRTLFGSGSLPLTFLRGCGLSDRVIDYLPSLIAATPIQFYSCFISYSTADQDFADRLHADLQHNGVRCWFAPHDMQPGKKVHEQIDTAIRVFDRLLLILSVNSMSSRWVETEIAKARQKEVALNRHVLFPVTLVPFEDVRAWEQFNSDLGEDTAKEIREYFLLDFSEWKKHDIYQRAFDRLLKALRSNEAISSGARNH